MSVGLAAAIILGAMVLLVLATMLIEQGGTVVQHIRLRGPGRPRNAAAEATAALRAASQGTEPSPTEPATPAPVSVHEPVDDRADDAPAVAASAVEAPAPDEPVADEPDVALEPAAVAVAAAAAAATASTTIESNESSSAEVDPEPAAAGVAPIAGLAAGALSTAKSAVTLRDPQTADTMVGVLLGAYIDGGGSAAKRASAWVTVRATPPSLDGEAFAPGADLRNRTGRVRTLFAATDLDAAWITLRTSVDIERGLRQSPLDDPTLDGLLVWWRSTRAVPAVIPPTAAARLAAAIASVDDRLEAHPWAEAIGQLHATLVAAAVQDQDVLVGFGSDRLAPADDRDDVDDDDRDLGAHSGAAADTDAPEPADAGAN